MIRLSLQVIRFIITIFRPHMSLDGKTPSEMAGIKIEGDDK